MVSLADYVNFLRFLLVEGSDRLPCLVVISYESSNGLKYLCLCSKSQYGDNKKVMPFGDFSVIRKVYMFLKEEIYDNFKLISAPLKRILGRTDNGKYILPLLISYRKSNRKINKTRDSILLVEYLKELCQSAEEALIIMPVHRKKWGVCIIVKINPEEVLEILGRILFASYNLRYLSIEFLPIKQLKKVVLNVIEEFRLPIMLSKNFLDPWNFIKLLYESVSLGIGHREGIHLESFDNIEKGDYSSLSRKSVENRSIRIGSENKKCSLTNFLDCMILDNILEIYDKIYGIKITIPQIVVSLIGRRLQK